MRRQIGTAMVFVLLFGGCATVANNGAENGQALPAQIERVKRCDWEARRVRTIGPGLDFSGRFDVESDLARTIYRQCMLQSP